MTRMHWLRMLGFAVLVAIATGSPALAAIQPQGKVFEVPQRQHRCFGAKDDLQRCRELLELTGQFVEHGAVVSG